MQQKIKEPAGRIIFTHAPLCHDINHYTCRYDRMDVIVGLASGDIVWIDPVQFRCTRFNKNGMVNKSPVRQIRWVPGYEMRFLSAHEDGSVFTWLVDRDDPPEGFQKGPRDLTWDPRTSIWVEKPQLSSTAQNNSALKMNRTKDQAPALYNPVSIWQVSHRALTDMAFSPDAKMLAITSEDKLLHLIDTEQEILLRTFASYFGGLKCVSWSPDGRFILTGGQDDLLSIWAPKDGHLVARAQGHHSYVSAVAFDPWCHQQTPYEGYRLVSTGEDGKMCFWDFSSWSLHWPRAQSNAGVSALHPAAVRNTSTTDVYIRAPPRAEVPVLHPTATFNVPNTLPCGLRISPTYIIILHTNGEMDLFTRPHVSPTQTNSEIPPPLPPLHEAPDSNVSSAVETSPQPEARAPPHFSMFKRTFSSSFLFGQRKNS